MTTISRQQKPMKRYDDRWIGLQLTGLGQTMKITTLALITTATVAATAMTGAAVVAPGAAAEPCPASGNGPPPGAAQQAIASLNGASKPDTLWIDVVPIPVTAAGRADWLASAPQAGQNLGRCRSRAPARYR